MNINPVIVTPILLLSTSSPLFTMRSDLQRRHSFHEMKKKREIHLRLNFQNLTNSGSTSSPLYLCTKGKLEDSREGKQLKIILKKPAQNVGYHINSDHHLGLSLSSIVNALYNDGNVKYHKSRLDFTYLFDSQMFRPLT